MKSFYRISMTVLMVVSLSACADTASSTPTDESPSIASKVPIAAEVASTPTVEPEDNVSKEFKNALSKAETYSTIMHISKQAIYDQLTSEYGEQFEADAAQYAIDNLNADFNAKALAKADNYSSTIHMSKKGIYDQLVSEYGEQFTPEEAQYAVDNLDK